MCYLHRRPAEDKFSLNYNEKDQIIAAIIECVPNFSEGNDRQIIEQITAAIARHTETMVLDVEIGKSANRSVITFLGTEEGILKGGFAAIEKAAELIDMTAHKGVHPCIGATDVFPLIPLVNTDEARCIALSEQLAKQVAEKLDIPVYLYEKSARAKQRKNLADIRKGGYLNFPQKMKDPGWQPDYGKPVFNTRSGATVIGVRDVLIAYNINLNTSDRNIAQDIALSIRESGSLLRNETGSIMRNARGEPCRKPGRLQAVKALGWYIDEYQETQVSMNLIDYKVTPPHIAYEEIKRMAEEHGIGVTGSEVIGLIPKQALLLAGRYYGKRLPKERNLNEKELLNLAVKRLGLDDIRPFDPDHKILDYRIAEFQGKLTRFNS